MHSRYIWNYGTMTPTMTLNGVSSKGQTPTKETLHAATYAFLRNAVSWLPVMFHFSTKDLNWLPSVVAKTSSSRPIIERVAPTVPKFQNFKLWTEICLRRIFSLMIALCVKFRVTSYNCPLLLLHCALHIYALSTPRISETINFILLWHSFDI